jgi:hypothetical protein
MRSVKLAIAVVACTASLAVACGGGGNESATSPAGGTPASSRTNIAGTPVARSTGGTEGGAEPLLAGPASAYAPAEADLGGAFRAMAPEVLDLDLNSFIAYSKLFLNTKQGEDMGNQWGYKQGFKTAFEPDGQLAGVLQGRFYISVETYLFTTTEGAKAAFEFIDKFYAGVPGSTRQDAKGLGNQSSGWKIVSGTIGPSSVAAAYHRFVFRRGSMVATVQTLGAEPNMTIDQAREVAVIIDDRALAKRPSATPTPIPNQSLPAVPSPAGN